MTQTTPKSLDTVALLRDLPGEGLQRGQVGAVVDDGGAETVLVEFSDSEGRTFALLGAPRTDLLVLSYDHVAAA